jgi:hypothetical protein
MAQIIKNRRGSIGGVKDVTTQNAEIIVASGSIGDLNGPFILYGSPTPSDNGLTGVYKPASKIYQGATVPTISVGTYGNVLDGTPFYASSSKTLYILSSAGNTIMDLAGNLSGSVFPYIIASGSFSGSFQGNGSGLTDISASSIVGLNLSRIATGSISASVDVGSTTFQITSGSSTFVKVLNTGRTEITGSLGVTGGITGSLLGTASFADFSTTASYAYNANTSSYAISSSQAERAVTASHALTALTASYSLTALSSSYAISSSQAERATTASHALTALTASYSLTALSSSYAISSSYAYFATTASHALTALTASYSLTALSSSYAISSSQAERAVTASFVATASYVPNLQEVTNKGSQTTNAITSSGLWVNGPAYISGNLDVQGTITYISSSTLQIGDNIIEINYNKAAGNSGMIVYDTTAPFTASMLWDAVADRWIAGPYGSESTIMLASDTSSMSVNFARTSSYSTTLGASLTSSATNQVRLLASDGGVLSTLTINNVESASYALSASYAYFATTASHAPTSVTASYALQALSASYSLSGSYANFATTASHALTALTASYSLTALSSSYALSGSYANFATTSSHALTAVTASHSLTALTASFALTSSYVNILNQNVVISGSLYTTTGIFDNSSGPGFHFMFMSSSNKISYVSPAIPGDLIQWNGTTMIASNLIDGGTF